MSKYLVYLYSVIIYSTLFFFIWKNAKWIFNWPKEFIPKTIWYIWVLFLLIFAQSFYHETDMAVWLQSFKAIAEGSQLPSSYVYLPVFAESISALAKPLLIWGLYDIPIYTFVVHAVLVFSYFISAQIIHRLLPDHEHAPLLIVLAPSVVHYIFFGTNHIVMLALLLGALIALKNKKWFWMGLLLSLLAYKPLTVPLIAIFLVSVALKSKDQLNYKNCLLGIIVGAGPTILYFIEFPNYLIKLVVNQGNIGGYQNYFDKFHLLYIPSLYWENLQSIYFDKKIWFLLSISGFFISLWFYTRNKINFIQALIITYITITVFAPEAYRIEPLIGLVTIDAVIRNDRLIISCIILLSFSLAFSWLPFTYPNYSQWNNIFSEAFFNWRGLFLGFICFTILLKILLNKPMQNKIESINSLFLE